MPTSEGTFDVFAKAQLHGILHKRPVGHQSNKWSKRFFIVKDGFLLYYSEVEMKDLKKRKRFSIHPKGALPLGGCTIEPAKEPGHIHSIHIKNDEDFDGVVVIAAETEIEQEKWLNVLRQSSRITWRNAQLGEAMIQQLENQGLQMAREKQDYYDQLQTEASALQDEKEQREELQRVKEELEKEKQELEEFTKGLREEYEKIKNELDETVQFMRKVEEDKQHLHETSEKLQQHLEDLAKEKQKVLNELKEREEVSQKLTEENVNLSQTTEDLKNSMKSVDEEKEKALQELQRHASVSEKLTLENYSLHQTSEELKNSLHLIEERTKLVMSEKMDAEMKLKEREEQTKMLEEEKQAYNEQAKELQESIKDLISQKETAEKELKEEVQARIEAEKQLKQAEEALSRLGKAVIEGGNKYTDETKEEMATDVAKLKRYFETVATEQKIECQMPIIMKNAVYAKKNYMRRAQTLKLNRKKKARSTAEEPVSPAGDLAFLYNDNGNLTSSEIRRAATFMVRDPQIRQSAMATLGHF